MFAQPFLPESFKHLHISHTQRTVEALSVSATIVYSEATMR